MKLNLGCGTVKIEGYINVDIRPEVKPDVVWDLEVFPYPWDNGSISEIYTSHTVEHVGYNNQDKMLSEFYRILKSGGKLIILCPDLEELFNQFINKTAGPGPFGHPHLFMEHFIFGGQDYPDNYHKAGYTPASMKYRLEKAGFRDIVLSQHLRADCVKP